MKTPWYKEPWAWLVFILPFTAVVAGIAHRIYRQPRIPMHWLLATITKKAKLLTSSIQS